MDKKASMEYWDSIDDECYNVIDKIAGFSTTKKTADIEDLEQVKLDTGAEIRDIIITALEELGYTFPFVDENY